MKTLISTLAWTALQMLTPWPLLRRRAVALRAAAIRRSRRARR